MDGIKKKITVLKEEKDAALEKAEEAVQQRKEAEEKCEAVSVYVCMQSHSHCTNLRTSCQFVKILAV